PRRTVPRATTSRPLTTDCSPPTRTRPGPAPATDCPWGQCQLTRPFSDPRRTRRCRPARPKSADTPSPGTAAESPGSTSLSTLAPPGNRQISTGRSAPGPGGCGAGRSTFPRDSTRLSPGPGTPAPTSSPTTRTKSGTRLATPTPRGPASASPPDPAD